MFCSQYLLHSGVSAGQLLPEIRHVMVILLHVLFEVLSEYQQRLFHFTLELKHIRDRVFYFRKLQETKARSKKVSPTSCLFIASVLEMHIHVYVQ